MTGDESAVGRAAQIRQALEERAMREPGSLEYDRAQRDVDRLVVEFVEHDLDGAATADPDVEGVELADSEDDPDVQRRAVNVEPAEEPR